MNTTEQAKEIIRDAINKAVEKLTPHEYGDVLDWAGDYIQCRLDALKEEMEDA